MLGWSWLMEQEMDNHADGNYEYDAAHGSPTRHLGPRWWELPNVGSEDGHTSVRLGKSEHSDTWQVHQEQEDCNRQDFPAHHECVVVQEPECHRQLVAFLLQCWTQWDSVELRCQPCETWMESSLHYSTF